ncbi:MAG: hypothetical protein Kow0037_00940 [Calditrichia bacterium]
MQLGHREMAVDMRGYLVYCQSIPNALFNKIKPPWPNDVLPWRIGEILSFWVKIFYYQSGKKFPYKNGWRTP